MDEVAAGAVWAETDGMEGAAQLSLILWVTAQAAQLMHAVGELALITILTDAVLFKGPAQLRLIAARVDLAASTHAHLTTRPQPVPQLRVGPLTEAVFLVVTAAQQHSGICFKAVDKLVLAEFCTGEAD